jgi:tetratricopeptide (TPR) repeat protein
MMSKSGAGPRMLIALAALLCAGCPAKRPGSTKVFAGRATSKPSSRPSAKPNAPFAPFANRGKKPAVAGESGVERALNLEGHTSLAQMKADALRLHAGPERGRYEQAYRMTFCNDKSKRDPQTAMQLYKQILQEHPEFAPAYRGVAYLFVDNGFQLDKAVEWYKRSVETDANYALGHYGLAFMLPAMGRADEGFGHFQKAMALGLGDERGLKKRFYANMNEGIRTH